MNKIDRGTALIERLLTPEEVAHVAGGYYTQHAQHPFSEPGTGNYYQTTTPKKDKEEEQKAE